MDTSTAKKIVETNYNYKDVIDLSKVLNDEYSNIDESYVNTDIQPDANSDYDSLALTVPPVHYRNRRAYTESIQAWFLGKVTEIFLDDKYFVAELKDIDTGDISVAEFDIESAFDEKADFDLQLFPGACFAFYVFTKHGMGSPQTSTGLEFTSPYIWQEEDNEKAREIYDEIFPDESS